MVLGLFWAVGLMGGIVSAVLLAQCLSGGRIELGDDAVNIGISLGVLTLIVGIVACSVVWEHRIRREPTGHV
jgi:hypothetical protein